MTQDELLEKAHAYATLKHEGQFRKGGEPYIVHPEAVCQYVKDWGYGLDYQITALFHDLLEDTDATDEEILALSNERVLEAVKLLTKEPGYVMEEYVSAIKANDIARVVKTADRLHNLRSALCCTEEFKRKYILETVDWYLDLSPEIKKAVKDLSYSIEGSLLDLPLDYELVDDWKE